MFLLLRFKPDAALLTIVQTELRHGLHVPVELAFRFKCDANKWHTGTFPSKHANEIAEFGMLAGADEAQRTALQEYVARKNGKLAFSEAKWSGIANAFVGT